MSKFPTQLKWSRFVCVLKRLGYVQMRSRAGSARTFHNPQRIPELVTFHEPHGNDTLRQGTLREYVEVKLRITREEFLSHLNEC